MMSKRMKNLKKYLKTHPFGLQGIIGKAFAVVIQTAVLISSVHPVWQLSSELVRMILTTGMQILASLYGLIVTGYIFFIGNQEQTASLDVMRADVVTHMKKRLYRNIILSTVFLALSLLMGTLSIFLTDSEGASGFLKRMVFGEAAAMFLSTGSVILAFVVTILDPDLIEKISIHGQQQLSTEDTAQDYSAVFAENYNCIQNILQSRYEQLHGRSAGRMSVERMANDLHINRKLDYSLWRRLAKLSQYNSFYHFSKQKLVSEDMYLLSDTLRQLLESSSGNSDYT